MDPDYCQLNWYGVIKMISVALNDYMTKTPIADYSNPIRRSYIVVMLSKSYAVVQ
jgi:hypothetical protein